MNASELKERYLGHYEYMANSKKPENMKLFGRVMTAMMDDMIVSNPSKAEEYIDKLESIKWKNFLTSAEADRIISQMDPKAPWTKELWKDAMEKHGFAVEEFPFYNRCALWVTMNMIMSDSGSTLDRYVGGNEMFNAVHDLALDKLKDKDHRFCVRRYFDV